MCRYGRGYVLSRVIEVMRCCDITVIVKIMFCFIGSSLIILTEYYRKSFHPVGRTSSKSKRRSWFGNVLKKTVSLVKSSISRLI